MHSPWSAFCQAAPHACHRANTQKCFFVARMAFRTVVSKTCRQAFQGRQMFLHCCEYLSYLHPSLISLQKKKKKQTGCVYFVHLYNWLQECHSTFWLQDYVKSLVLSVDAKLLYVLIMLVDLTCYPWYKQLIFVDLKSKESFIHLDCKMVIPFLKKNNNAETNRNEEWYALYEKGE